MMRKTFVEELVMERTVLSNRLERLGDILASPDWLELDEAEKTRIHHQRTVMEIYRDILDERIGARSKKAA